MLESIKFAIFFLLFHTKGAVHNIVAIDCKKQSNSKSAAFDFHVKKVSAYGVEKDIIEEIHKFPLPFQHLLIKEACAIMDRLEKGFTTSKRKLLECLIS
ncbi:unnamed protein product [Rhizophagus irregularis]|nr:unnamed protein product [Rhizophagus irregularis]